MRLAVTPARARARVVSALLSGTAALLLCASGPRVCAARAPDKFLMELNTDIDGNGVIGIEVTRAWAPIGVDHLYALLQDHFYDEAAFFRVYGGFLLQWGIAGSPAENAKWSTPIDNDPVVQSNLRQTVSYAVTRDENSTKNNNRTTQLFINYADHPSLDKEGFVPFGTVVTGWEYTQRVFDPTPGDPAGVNQTDYITKGNQWIRTQYPEINFVRTAVITPSN